ncbi:hypothetical protein QL989_19000, partial [Pseudoalteromonas sp. APC 3224]|uniref:hypothetical protein n=2 Tax=unclassified Pseudoalteromonas TaxID=194690 RepID=UPI0025B5D3FE
VHCLNEEVFVISNTFPQNIFLDWISYSGTLLGQFKINFSGIDSSDYIFVNAINRNSEAIHLSVMYFNQSPRQQEKMKPYIGYDVLININASERWH